jgi:hypothetical protein
LFKALGGHAGDNRQWPDIDAWAERGGGGEEQGSSLTDDRGGGHRWYD